MRSTRLNMLGIVCGPSDYGKSTILRGVVLDHLQSHRRARAFVQDPHGEYEDMARTYASASEARAALATDPRTPRGFSIRDAWSSVRDLAMEVGRNAGNSKKGGVHVPVLAAADESSLMDSSSKTNMSREDIDVVSNRVHYGVALLLNVQAVKNLTEGWYQNATHVWIFSQSNDDDARELERRLGIDKGTLRRSKVWRAPPFIYALWRRGEGLVSL